MQVNIRIPGQLHRLLERKSLKDGISKSEIVRIALTRYFVEEQAGADTPPKGAELQETSNRQTGIPPKKGAA